MLLDRTQYLLVLRQQITLLLLEVVEAVRVTEVVVAVVVLEQEQGFLFPVHTQLP
jgi:hypothetical protein